MGDRAPTYAEQEAWRRADHDLFRGIGAELDEAIPVRGTPLGRSAPEVARSRDPNASVRR